MQLECRCRVKVTTRGAGGGAGGGAGVRERREVSLEWRGECSRRDGKCIADAAGRDEDLHAQVSMTINQLILCLLIDAVTS